MAASSCRLVKKLAAMGRSYNRKKNGSDEAPVRTSLYAAYPAGEPGVYQLKPAPAETLFSSPLNAPAIDTLARLPMAR